MDKTKNAQTQIRVTVPIRVRGLSIKSKYFDEETETAFVSDETAVIRLRNLVDLETEIHVISLKSNVGGTFRVAWANTRDVEGFHATGLELLDPEGDLWELATIGAAPGSDTPVPEGWLECRRCHRKLLTPVPEVRAEYLQEGLVLSRHCETCKATTAWALGSSSPPELETPQTADNSDRPAHAGTLGAAAHDDLRAKGRAPLEMLIKIIRRKYGVIIEDICKTTNISRNGVYFLTLKNYDLGEPVQVVFPYKEGDVSILTPASVVRLDHSQGMFEHGVALKLEPPAK